MSDTLTTVHDWTLLKDEDDLDAYAESLCKEDPDELPSKPDAYPCLIRSVVDEWNGRIVETLVMGYEEARDLCNALAGVSGNTEEQA